jgi:hypothetical protein
VITSWADSRSETNNSLGQGQDLDSYLFYNIGVLQKWVLVQGSKED